MSTTTVQKALAQLRKPVDLKSLPRKQARVEIAKDVLAAMDADRLRVGMSYLTFDSDTHDGTTNRDLGDQQLRDVLGRAKYCSVCAIGAALVAVVGRENDMTCGDAWSGFNLNCSSTFKKLAPYFSEGELRTMEACFEGMYLVPGPAIDAGFETRAWNECATHLRKYSRPERLKKIMRMIIRSGGASLPKKPQKA